MITIKHVKKRYYRQEVLKDITLSFPEKGLYFILGESGCGKTTLLNAIAGLIDYQGEILIDGENVSLLSDEQASNFRLKNIGFVYQDFKLFNHDNVFDNVSLPLKIASHTSKDLQRRRVEDILEIVSLQDRIDDDVNTLSGGEKQRIAVARAMINNPKVLLCDEPTGALDTTNKVLLMTMLKTIATTRLVIVVSHDDELSEKYGDGIFYLKDGQLAKSKIKEMAQEKIYLPIFQANLSDHKRKLPLNFLFSHTKNAIKERKFRSVITNLVVSFGLLGSGMAFTASDIIYDSVVGMYSNIVSDNQIIANIDVSKQKSSSIESVSIDQIHTIKRDYKSYINDDGVCYFNDFENFFPDLNELSIASTTYRYKISGYSARNINDFVWLDYCTSEIYPMPIEELRDDEIIIAINPKDVKELCHIFRIEKTLESLSNYVLKNDILLCFNFINNYWGYHDEQLFKLRGFIFDNKPTIYHSNHIWNELVFEKYMHFPSSENISRKEYYPWVLKKIRYLDLKDDNEHFLTASVTDDELDDFRFEIANKMYFPRLYNEVDCSKIKRVLTFKNTFTNFPTSDWKYIKNLEKTCKNPIFSTNSGYSVYGTNLLSGFNKMMFMASDLESLNATTDTFVKNNYDPTSSLKLPEGILVGHFSKTSNNGVFYQGLEGKEIIGDSPHSINEIVISKGIAKTLFADENPIGKKLHLSSLNYSEFSNNKYRFKNTELLITGCVNNSKNILYHNEYWSLLFFQCKLGVSTFELMPYGISIEIDQDKPTKEVINLLKENFPYYEFSNPMEDIEKQANSLCFYMRIILLILSIITLIIAVFLISICNYLHVVEIKKDIGLIRCIGVNKKEACKMLYSHSLFIAMLGAITCVLELILMQVLMKFGLADLFKIETNFHFNPIPYILVILISLFIGIVPAYFTAKKIKKLDPLEAMKR